MEENVTEEQPKSGSILFAIYATYKIIKYIIKSTVSYIRTSTD